MARKTPALADAFAEAQAPAATKTAPDETADAANQPPSRRGRRAITFYVDPAAHQQLRILGIEAGESTQALMTEAVNALFERRGKPPIA